jgi:pimeloyl-ACP methyl ester carboxylesterase
MDKYVKSSDGVEIHYEIRGSGPVGLLFVHGWLGNCSWWSNQISHFSAKFTVICMELAGHGKSGTTRVKYSSTQYAEDIKAVAGQFDQMDIILIGHSMSGPYVLEASPFITQAKAIILVDTLKDPDLLLSYDKADEFLFKPYRQDFKSAVRNILPQYLFTRETPLAVKEQLENDFLKYDGETAVKLIEPLYLMDAKKIAGNVKIPVRAINSDPDSTNRESLRKIFNDFDYVSIQGTGHYPMLEKPLEFNKALAKLLAKL